MRFELSFSPQAANATRRLVLCVTMFKQVIVAALVASATAFAPAPFGVKSSALNAEWKPDGQWKETDFEAEIKKLEKEAEERLDDKIAELTSNIASAGEKES